MPVSAILRDEALATGEAPAGRRGLAWLAVGLLAFLVFEWTADPALAVAACCLKFGGDGLATARWLRRTDPDRRRGRVVARFHTASAFWNVAGIATAMGIVAAQVARQLEALRRGPALNGPPRQVLGAFVVALVAFALAGLLSLFAVGSAWWGRVRVWHGPQARRARRLGLWPPSLAGSRPADFNGAILIVLVALLAVAIPAWFATTIAAIVAVVACVGPKAPLLPAVSVGVVLPIVAFFLFARGVVAARAAVLGRIAASSPLECWPLDEAREPSGPGPDEG
jgi:hypothetical protein